MFWKQISLKVSVCNLLHMYLCVFVYVLRKLRGQLLGSSSPLLIREKASATMVTSEGVRQEKETAVFAL